MNTIAADQECDASGLLCPLPVLRARKALKSLQTGEILRLIATDEMARIDLPHFCVETGNELLATIEERDHTVFYIEKS